MTEPENCRQPPDIEEAHDRVQNLHEADGLLWHLGEMCRSRRSSLRRWLPTYRPDAAGQ